MIHESIRDSLDAAEVARCLFEESNDAQIIFNPKSLQLIDVNPHAQKLTELPRRQLLEKTVPELFEETTPDLLQELFDSCQATCLFHSREAYLLTRVGSAPLEVNVTVSRLHTRPDVLGVIAIRDVSERRALEADLRATQALLRSALEDQTEHLASATEGLRKSERRYRMLFEESQDAICLFDTDGVLQICNREARHLLGYLTESESSLSDLFADRNEWARFNIQLQRRRQLRSTQFRMRRKNGEAFDALVSVNVRTEVNGRFGGYQVIIRDISEMVQLQERLAETEKMEAIGRMAGGIAHDFNNFLAVVMYGAESVKPSGKENPELKAALRMILSAAESGRKLTSQIQTFSRAPVVDLKVIDTASVFSAISSWLQGVVPKSVELEIQLDDGLGSILGDAHQLEQVVVNLAANACHAMSDQGTLKIKAVNADVDESRADELRIDPGQYVLLRVADTGKGMDAATRSRIFDPFFTTKIHGEGTGLGLAIVYGIVTQFRGHVRVDSTLGESTCFDLYFPISREEAVIEPATSGVNPDHGTETILFVDDEPCIRKLVRHSLELHGYTVHVAGDPSEAKAFIEANDGIDLVISDVIMRGTSGLDLVTWLRAMRPDTAILLISGHPDPNAKGVPGEIEVPFLAKPFRPTELASCVRDILDSTR